jgi:hypothetical protein
LGGDERAIGKIARIGCVQTHTSNQQLDPSCDGLQRQSCHEILPELPVPLFCRAAALNSLHRQILQRREGEILI